MNLTREKMHWAGSVTTDQKEAMGQGQTKTWTLLEPGCLGVDLEHGGTSWLRGYIKTTTIDSHRTERFPSKNREVNTPLRDSQEQGLCIRDEHMPCHLRHRPLHMDLSSLCSYLGIQPGPSPNLTSIQYLPRNFKYHVSHTHKEHSLPTSAFSKEEGQK